MKLYSKLGKPKYLLLEIGTFFGKKKIKLSTQDKNHVDFLVEDIIINSLLEIKKLKCKVSNISKDTKAISTKLILLSKMCVNLEIGMLIIKIRKLRG